MHKTIEATGRDRYADMEWDDTVTVLCIAERTAR